MADINIRLATEFDCLVINDIYNHYVLHSTCTYQTEPEPLQQRHEWFAAHGALYPVTVAELDGTIVGWGSLSRFHPRAAYGRTVESAVYIHHDFQGRGIGKNIVTDLIQRAKNLNHHTVIALISSEQTASLALHEKLGFARSGHLKEAGYKMQRWLDVIYLQRMLRE